MKSMRLSEKTAGSLGAPTAICSPASPPAGRRALLDGNLARKKLPPQDEEYVIWDTELPGFGLRVRPSGRRVWFVRVRQRGTQRRIALGAAEDVDAVSARKEARRLLGAVAVDGLPKKEAVKAAPTMREFVEANWNALARQWKKSTRIRHRSAWMYDLGPVFGDLRVADITRADVIRWRDDCASRAEARFNRAVSVLACLLKYAEAIGLRPKGSNPCRGLPQYKRRLIERYLSPVEYRRLGVALREEDVRQPARVAIIRLLLYTGARVGEIRDLRWEWVHPPRLCLPDSKTGPKTIWLNRQAVAILGGIPRRPDCPFVFPNDAGTAPINLTNWWPVFRRSCGMPDLRIHDLRHSFASTAIMENVPLSTIGKLLGHALPETTARYAHLSDNVIADAAQRISGLLASAIGLRS